MQTALSSQATEVRAARHAQQQGTTGVPMSGSSSGGSEEEAEGAAAVDAADNESLHQTGPPSVMSNRSNGRARNWFISRRVASSGAQALLPWRHLCLKHS